MIVAGGWMGDCADKTVQTRSLLVEDVGLDWVNMETTHTGWCEDSLLKQYKYSSCTHGLSTLT